MADISSLIIYHPSPVILMIAGSLVLSILFLVQI